MAVTFKVMMKQLLVRNEAIYPFLRISVSLETLTDSKTLVSLLSLFRRNTFFVTQVTRKTQKAHALQHISGSSDMSLLTCFFQFASFTQAVSAVSYESATECG